MGIIQNILRKSQEKKERMREIENNDRMLNNLETKKLSHDERIIIKGLEEERAEVLKEALKWDERKRKALDKLRSREMMQFNSNMFQDEKNNLLKWGFD